MGFWITGLIGLFISGAGAVFAFFGTPKDTTGYAVLAGSNTRREHTALRRRSVLSKIGFALLMVGFVLQFIAAFGSMPAA